MKYLVRKDKKKRDIVKVTERERLILKSIVVNRFIKKELRNTLSNVFAELSKVSTKIVNRCVVTGRAGGVIRKYKISRMVFKEYAGNGLLEGIHKSSW